MQLNLYFISRRKFLPCSIGNECFSQSLEDADELSGQSWKIVNDQGQGSGRGSLQLLRLDWRDGGATPGLVRDPVQWVLQNKVWI